jgi:predicted  nucleic acid-binding Zn-ribbon protein
MHKCVRCNKTASSIGEINAGCSCGSKVFVFIRDANEQANDPLSSEPKAQVKFTEVPKSDGPENGKAPSSYFARMSFTNEDVENIKIITEGVFMVDVNALSKNPVVLKDEEGVYYVRLPFDQDGKKETKGEKQNGKNGNGSKTNGEKTNGKKTDEEKK